VGWRRGMKKEMEWEGRDLKGKWGSGEKKCSKCPPVENFLRLFQETEKHNLSSNY